MVPVVGWLLLLAAATLVDFDFVHHCGLTVVSLRHNLALPAFAESCSEDASQGESHEVVAAEVEWPTSLLYMMRRDIAVPIQCQCL